MPSNNDLITEISELSEKLGTPVETDGLKNADLAVLLSDLKAKERDAENTTQADGDSAPEADAEAKAKADAEAKAKADAEAKAKALPPFTVAPGKAITSKRGMLDSGDKVQASDLPGGEHSLKTLIETGHVIEN